MMLTTWRPLLLLTCWRQVLVFCCKMPVSSGSPCPGLKSGPSAGSRCKAPSAAGPSPWYECGSILASDGSWHPPWTPTPCLGRPSGGCSGEQSSGLLELVLEVELDLVLQAEQEVVLVELLEVVLAVPIARHPGPSPGFLAA